MLSEKIQVEEEHTSEKDINGDTIMNDYSSRKRHGYEGLNISARSKEAQELFDKLSKELNVIRTTKQHRDKLKISVDEMYTEHEEKDKEFGELVNQIKEARQKNKVLDNQLLESQNRRTRFETIQRNQKNVDHLKEIAFGQMNQIIRLRSQLAREIAGRNNKSYSRKIYELEKIPIAWNNCSTFEEAKVSLKQKNEELATTLHTEAVHMPQHNRKIEELEKLAALRAVEAQLHQINQKEILEEIDKIWEENSKWWSEVADPQFTDAHDYGKEYQMTKQQDLNQYEELKGMLKERYGLEDWS